MRPVRQFLFLAICLAAAVFAPALNAQVLIKEVISREVSLHVGGIQTPEIKEIVSREVSLNVENGPAGPYPQVISREVSLAVGTAAAPPAITDLVISVSPTGDSATLNWSTYNQWAVGDIGHFAIFLSDTAGFTDVSQMTPYRIVPGESTSVTLTGLTPWTDHFFAVVAVDVLGNFLPAVTYSAAYVLSPEVISREISLFVGAEPDPPYRQVISREVSLAVVSPTAPSAIAEVAVTLSPTGDAATLTWASYNQWAVGDVVRFDIYLSDDGPITNVSGLTPFTSVGAEQNAASLSGLTPWRDHFFAVVAVDGLGNFLPVVNYSAGYVLAPEVISREISLFVGAEPEPPYRQVVSREVSIIVPDAAIPAPVTGISSGFTASTSTADFGAVVLDWSNYNEVAQRDIVRYRVYVSDQFFDNVTAMAPFAYLPAGSQRQTLSGLTGLGIFHFAVVAEDALGGFDPVVRSFSAQASVSGVGEARNLAVASGPDTLTFTWQSPQGTDNFLTGYRVYFAGSATPISLPANATSWTATGLERGSGYPFRLTTLNVFGGESGGTSITGATWLENPANVALTTVGDEILMTWNASQPVSLVRYYAIYRSAAPITNVTGLSPAFVRTGTSAILGGFAQVAGQHFAVAAVNLSEARDPAVQSVHASKEVQTIDFPALATTSYQIPLVATASSGLPVTFASSASSIATINGSTLAIQQGGAVTITATQAGNAAFWPASAAQSLRVPPVITSFTANGTELQDGAVLRQGASELRVTARDAQGISEARFSGRAPGGEWSSLGIDNTPGNGFSAPLPVETLPGGPYQVRVEVATASGFTSARFHPIVLDLQPVLTVTLAGEIIEGAQLNGTVSLQRARAQDLVVSLSSSQPTQLESGPPVTIPAGQTSLPFRLFGRQDEVIEGPLDVRITATAPGAVSVERLVQLLDDDWPSLTLNVDRTAVSESAGSNALMATIGRTPVSTLPLTVWLTSSNTTDVVLPQKVIIPAGAATLDLPVGVIDNLIDDGPRTANLGAEVRLSGLGAIAESTEVSIEIGDDEGPSLELAFDGPFVSEGESPTLRLRRVRGAFTKALSVRLTANPATKLQLPASVTIPAGQGEITVNATAPDNGVTDGNSTVRVSATATGHNPAQLQLLITDRVLPDLVPIELALPQTEIDTETPFSLSYTIRNQGTAATSQTFLQRVFLSTDRVPGNDILLTQHTFSGGLGTGSQFQRIENLRTPRDTGSYWVIVTTDAGLAVEEVLEGNNSIVSAEPVIVQAAYSAVVATDTTIVPANTPITFTGSALRGDQSKVPNALVNVHVLVAGTKRIVNAITDANGDFVITWRPLPGEGGDYQIGATHPGVSVATVQDSFSILTVRTEFPTSAVALEEASHASFVATITNPTTHPLTGLALVPVNLPVGLTIEATLPATTLAAGARVQVGVSVTAATGYSGSRTVTLRLTTAEGVIMDINLPVNVRPLLPKLVMTPNPIHCSVLRGEQKTVNVVIENQGGAESGPINVLIPNVPWMELASAMPLPSLAPGASANFSVLLKPGATDALTVHNGTLVVDPANGASLNLPFAIRVVSDRRGDLQIEVVDEYFFFTAEKPKVEGATVVIRDAITAEEMARTITGANGLVIFPELLEGWYSVEVDSPNHTRVRANYSVLAEEASRSQIFVSRELVTYTWTVEEVEVLDRYRISVESTFETNVPAPVVTVSPSRLDVEDLTDVGQSKVVNLTIENHGFIGAENGRFSFGTHPFYEISPLIQDVGTIPAKSAIVVPVSIRRIAAFREDGSIQFESARVGPTDPQDTAPPPPPITESSYVPCEVSGGFLWTYQCGPSGVNKNTPIAISGVTGRRCGGVIGGGGSRNRSGMDGKPSSRTITFSTPTVCDCQDEDICLEGRLAFSMESIATRALEAIKSLLPPWLDLDDENITLNVGGKLCRCCSSFLGYSGGIDGGAEVTVTVTVGLQGELEFEVPAGAGFTELEIDGEVLLGIELPIRGFIGGKLGNDCAGKTTSCVEGGLELKPFAGAQAQVEIEAKGASGEELKGTAQLRVGASGEIFAGITGCEEDGEYRLTACVGNLQVGATLSGSLESQTASGVGGLVRVQLSNTIYRMDGRRCLGEPSPPPALAARSLAADTQAAESNPPPPSEPSTSTDPYVSLNPADFRMAPAQVREALGLSEPSGVCSRVKIRVDQDAVMTRSAFQASLQLSNNQETTSLTLVGFDLDIRDHVGQASNPLFNIQVSNLTGLAAIDGTGVIAPDSTGSAQWTLIPRDSAAPLADTVYTIGGTITYNQGGTDFSIPVVPVQITVRPDAALHLKYFHQRDVFSDDPHTDVIEPAVPYHLAVMVENRGAGAARNLSITSAQPEIVENEKGLLIDFNIIGTQVAGQPRSPSLRADFGSLDPSQRKVATWDITSSLQGLFIDYKATFQHLDGFGDERLSLIKDVAIHEMIQMIEAQGALADGLPDFLVNDVADINDRPDTVHLSNGSTASVTVVEIANLSQAVSPTNLTVTLSTTQGSGWSYLRIPDPGNGAYRIASVVRSDGTVIPAGKNAWITDRTFIGLGRRPIIEPIFHLVDFNSTGAYTLAYEIIGPDSTAPTSSILALPSQSPSFIPVRWTGQDDRGLAHFDIYVSDNGGPFTRWLTATTRISSLYQGQTGRTYAFYSRGTDTSGNTEPVPPAAQASTTVGAANLPPVLNPIGNRTITEGGTLAVAARANDPDGLNDLLRFSVTSEAPGLIIDPVSGALTWVTHETDGGRTVQATVTVTDAGSPAQSDTETFSITVEEDNRPPVINSLPAGTVDAESTFSVTATARDPDFPAQNLTFALGPNAPEGMTIDPVSGTISWLAPGDSGDQSFPVEVIVSDSGNPQRSASANFVLTVHEEESEAEPPTVETIEVQEFASTSARSGGRVTEDGGAPVSERGVVYATVPRPRIGSAAVMVAELDGDDFNSWLVGLSPSTRYYLRAYAVNSAGTAYGEEVSFVTTDEAPGVRRLLYLKSGDPARWTVPAAPGSQSIEIGRWREAGFEVALGDANSVRLTQPLLSRYRVLRLFTAVTTPGGFPDASGAALDTWVRSGGVAIVDSARNRGINAIKRFGVSRIDGSQGGDSGTGWIYKGSPLITGRVAGSFGPIGGLAASTMDRAVLIPRSALRTAAAIGRDPAVVYGSIGLGKVVIHFIENWSHDSSAPAAPFRSSIGEGSNLAYLERLMTQAGRATPWDEDLPVTAMVAQPIEIPLPVDSGAILSVKGLPSGLVYDPALGIITGSSRSAGAFDILVNVRELSGSNRSILFTLRFVPLPSESIGTFAASLARDPNINDNLGGRLSITTTNTGAASGQLTLGNGTLRFTGNLLSHLSGQVELQIRIPRGDLPEIALNLTLLPDNSLTGNLRSGAEQLEVEGYRNVWSKTHPASVFAGFHTFGLELPSESVEANDIPQGTGFGNITVAAPTGGARIKGYLSDGTSFTHSAFTGPQGQLPFFQLMYPRTNRGSLVGSLAISATGPADSHTVGGTLNWFKPGMTVIPARLYGGGIGPIHLTARGGRYLAPVSPAVVLGLDPTIANNARLVFTAPDGGEVSPLPSPEVTFSVGPRSRITLPTGGLNPRRTTLRLNPTDGTFLGAFTLVDLDPAGSGKNVSRQASYRGQLLRNGSGEIRGYGYYLLPEFADPNAVPPTTAKTSPILSGQVSLEPAAP